MISSNNGLWPKINSIVLRKGDAHLPQNLTKLYKLMMGVPLPCT